MLDNIFKEYEVKRKEIETENGFFFKLICY